MPRPSGNAIARILRDAPLAARLCAGARARAPMFSIENTVDRTMDIYRELLAAIGNAMSDSLGVMLLTTAENWRGSGMSFSKIARGLAERGHRVELVVASSVVAAELCATRHSGAAAHASTARACAKCSHC